MTRATLQGRAHLRPLTPADYEYLFASIRLLAFELGLRFFTDHLAGNVYFKVKYPGHNLQRALVQFKLTESIEAHEAEIRNIIAKMVEVESRQAQKYRGG